MANVSIKGLDKAEVLASLYNASAPQGMGFIHARPEPMTREQAATIVAKLSEEGRRLAFDYLIGRVMKVDLSGDEFNPGGYDRDNGQGAAQRALVGLAPASQPSSR